MVPIDSSGLYLYFIRKSDIEIGSDIDTYKKEKEFGTYRSEEFLNLEVLQRFVLVRMIYPIPSLLNLNLKTIS